MKRVTLFLVLAIVNGIYAQDLTSVCATAAHDIQTCAEEILSQVSDSVSSALSDPSQVLSATSVVSGTYFKALCENSARDNVKDFYKCFLNKFYKCVPENNRRLFASITSTIASIDHLCDNIKDIDLSCLGDVTLANDFLTCTSPHSFAESSYTVDNLLKHTCRSYPALTSCLKKAYGSCPKKTSDVLGTYMEFHLPQGCAGCGCVFLPSFLLLIAAVTVLLLNNE